MQTSRSGAARRPLVIANPRAGRGRAGRGFAHLVRAIRASVGDVDVAETRRPGHATGLAAAAADDRRPLVISLGGDGTLNEIVNGLLGGRRHAGGPGAGPQGPLPPAATGLPLLGVIAAGTGGDFGRALGLPHRFEDYVAAIAGGAERTVDVGRAHFTGNDGCPADRYWINVLSAGIGGLVDRFAAGVPGFLGGRLAYAQATLRAIIACRRVKLRCRAVLPDGSDYECLLHAHAVAICNGTTFGGGMRVAPMAQPGDGLLEVITVETETKVLMLRRMRTLYAGTHLTEPGIGHFSCRSLELLPAEEPAGRRPRAGVFPLDVDGEALGDVPLSVEVVPGALRVCVPAAPGGPPRR